jgi:MSHA biogenesis protein MshK
MKTLTNPYLATLLLMMTAQAATADRLQDPTRPANARAALASTPKAESVRLEAIFRSDGTNVAIVNGKVVRTGDRIGSVRIDEVMPHGIRYTREGRTHTTSLDGKAPPIRQNVVSNEDET